MFACQKGQPEVARTLVQHQASVNAVDNSDKSALIYAAEHGHLEIVELLVACDWITQPNELGLVEAAQQASVIAASKGNIQVIQIIFRSDQRVYGIGWLLSCVNMDFDFIFSCCLS